MNLLRIYKIQVSPDAWTLSLRGSLDASNVEAIGAAAKDVLSNGARHVFMNLENAEYVSSAGFSAFLKIADELAATGGRVIFVATPPRIKEIFKILGLAETLAFAPDHEAAMAFVASVSPDSASTPLHG